MYMNEQLIDHPQSVLEGVAMVQARGAADGADSAGHTLAHELAHALGADHDDERCSKECTPCVMAAKGG